MTAILFAALVLSWGFTWFAIKLQLGVVPPEVSICYRFVLAAAVLWLGLAATRRLRPVPWRAHRWFVLQGLTLFGLNFVLIYSATQHIASGIVSVLFTTATVFNAFNQWLFMRRVPQARVLAGAVMGMAGIALLFWRELDHLHGNRGELLGVGLALAGTYVFSLGNMVSMRVARDGVDLPNAMARGMTWGAACLALFALWRGNDFVMPSTPVYLFSLLYLAIIGSVLGFFAYLSLVTRIGADRAAYATVLFPLVALVVSTLFEGYAWTPWAFAGLCLILLGNLAIFARWPARARPA